MDLYCPVCGEPWDHDSLHEETTVRNAKEARAYSATFATVSAEFREKGCKALTTAFGEQSHCEPREQPRDPTFGLTRSEAASALYDFLGDDMDGAAAMLDDINF